jgi:arsenite methyltransferase
VNYLDPIDFTTPGFGELYDELPLWSAPFGLALLERVPLLSQGTILDVGAGTGFLALELAERCGPNTTVIAVDPWQRGVERLRRKLEHHGLTNVRVIEQDAALVDLPNGSVDLIVSNLGINNFDDPHAVLRTCFRVARSGAKVLLTTNPVGHMAELYDVYRSVLIELGQEDRLPLLEAHIAHRGTVDSCSALLETQGFRVVEVIQKSFRLRFVDGSALLRHYFIRMGFVPGWKSIAAPDQIERTFETLEHRLNDHANKHGEVSLTIPVLCLVATKP